MFDLNTCQLFVKVVELESFTAAAEYLDIPKQTISRKIAALEEKFGVRLLERSTRNLRLTGTGEVFYESALEILDLAQRTQNNIGSHAVEPKGHLCISATHLFCEMTLRHVVLNYIKQHPKVTVEILTSNNHVDLYNQNVDVAIKIGPLRDSSLISKRLAPTWMSCLVSPKLIEKFGHPTHPQDLQNFPVIAYNEPIYQGHNSFKFYHQNQISYQLQNTPVLTSNCFWLCRQAALEGLGVVQLPGTLCQKDIQQGKLQPILQDWLPTDNPILAVFPSRKMLSLHVRTFLEMLQEAMPQDLSHPTQTNVTLELTEPSLRIGL